jgi:[acyl-carrier-protein] S-malonyltransferase
MAKTAFLFPGQGAQHVGMGREFYDHFPAARTVFDRAAAVLGEELLRVIFEGPEDDLLKTANTQPAILTVSIAMHAVLRENGCRAQGAAGLSLGEYSALVAAGSISFDDALPLVQKRGRYMQETVPQGRGIMTAILGLSAEQVEEACRLARPEGIASPANYNCPGQVVISGDAAAVRRAAALAREAGAKKVTELKVSAPFHCALLEPVEEKIRRELDRIELHAPDVPVVFNVSAAVETGPDRIKAALVKQVSSPIMWEHSIRALVAAGYDTFIDVGPGSSLVKLMKRIDPTVYAASVEDRQSLEAVVGYLKGVS